MANLSSELAGLANLRPLAFVQAGELKQVAKTGAVLDHRFGLYGLFGTGQRELDFGVIADAQIGGYEEANPGVAHLTHATVALVCLAVDRQGNHLDVLLEAEPAAGFIAGLHLPKFL